MMDYGIKIDKVSRPHLVAVLQSFEDPDADEPDLGKLVAVAARRFALMPDLGACDVCGGVAPSSFAACPFCGDVGEVVNPPVNGSSNGAKTTALARTKTKAGIIVKATTPAETEKKDAVVDVEKILAASERLNTDDEREAYAWCRAAKVVGAVALWKLGQGISVVVDKKLWAQVKKKNGKQAFYSFDAWCREKLGMTHGNAYDLMDVAKKFTQKQVRDWGATNCALLLRAPDEARAAIEAKVASGELKTTREVKASVREARATAGTTGKPRSTGRKSMPQPKTRPLADKITVALTKPTRVLHFVTSATSKSEEPKAAKRIADEPVVEVELTNRTKLRISLSHDNAGNIVGRMTVKRDAP